MLTLADGTLYTYDYTTYASPGVAQTVFLSSIRRPDGMTTTLDWETRDWCTPNNNPPGQGCGSTTNSGTLRLARLDAVTSSAGYRINYTYQRQYFSSGDPAGEWQTLTGASGSNVQGGSGPLPSVSYAQATTAMSGGGYNQTLDVTDGLNRTWRYTKQYLNGSYEAVRRPGSGSDNVRVNMTDAGIVTSVVRDGATWLYAYSISGNMATLSVTDPTGRVRKYVSDRTVGLPTRVEDEYGRASVYTYDARYRLATGTTPGGPVTTYSYDDRDNATGTVVTPAGGGATLSTSAVYPPSCTNPVTCNRPTSTTDVRGQVTSYAWDGTHGGVTRITAPVVNGVSPETRLGYAQVGGVWLPTSASSCRTQGSCTNTADETRTTTSYNANLLPASVTAAAGDGSVSATKATTYTAAGDVLSVDGPLAGSDDTARYYYDAARQPLGAVGPDPDAGGALKRRAVKTGYDSWGRATSASIGTASDQGDGALANMSVLQVQSATLDDAGRPTRATLSAGGTTYAVSQYSYDAAGHAVCSALRMDPGQWNGQSNACSPQTNGGQGPDRVSLTEYSPAGAGQPVWMRVTSAYGTAEAASETVTQTATGQVGSVSDGNGNVTTYGYDGFDRPTTTTYPGGSAEQLSYAANGDLTSRLLRDGQSIAYGYDALGRVTSVTRPGGVYWQVNHSYGYDLLGHVASASDSNGRSLTFGYDALGRQVSQGDNWYVYGNATYQYDLAGRRTRLIWADGNYAGYDYLVTGEMRSVNVSGGAALVTFGYDDLGRRTSLVRANGTSTSYGYDPASRLTGLVLSGGNQPTSVTLGYNPAGQIVSRTGTNDAYAFSGQYNVDRAYGVNGLNQLTSAGGTALGYDGRGNLTSSGSDSYGYTVDNRLATAPGANLAYDPLGRLFNVNAENGVNTTLTYAGGDAIAEIDQNGGALLRRYVYGPGSDEPLLWYEGAGLSDRRWLNADERGSIVAVTNDAGTALAVNTYDDYGIPAAGNLGRFQYTGQKWLPSVGVYDYKARMYSPTLGRFLQTDPIGYGDGMNAYNYVGSDPVNAVDPSGLQAGDIIVNGGSVSSGPCPKGTTYQGMTIDSNGRATPNCQPDIIVNGGARPTGPLLGGYVPSLQPSPILQPYPGGWPAPVPRRGNAPQRTQTPSPCQRAFLKSQLASRGLPTSQIDSLKFVSGLDAGANALTRRAFGGGATAVTQGTTVYVQPGRFNEVANFRSAIPFEEAYHTAQFASDSGFYSTYGLLSLGGLLSIGDSYKGNLYEAFAQGASQQMFDASKAGMCPSGG